MEDFKRLELDEETLTGLAETSYDNNTTANSELEVIQRACQKESIRMSEGMKVAYDERRFSSKKVVNEDGSTTNVINFGFELKTDE